MTNIEVIRIAKERKEQKRYFYNLRQKNLPDLMKSIQEKNPTKSKQNRF